MVEATAIVEELQDLRKGHGLTLSKVIGSSDLMAVGEALAAGSDLSAEDKALAVIEQIHDFLHKRQGEKNPQAAASALNLDIARPWNGQIVALAPGTNVKSRRTRAAKAADVGNKGGKPLTGWENEAFADLAEHLLKFTANPPAESASISSTDAAVEEQPVLAPVAEPLIPPAPEQRSKLGLRWPAATAVALAAAFALVFYIGTQFGDSDDSAQPTELATPTVPASTPTTLPLPEPTAEPANVVPAVEPTATPLPAPTSTPAPTASPLPTATPEPAPTATPVPSPTPTAVPQPTPTPVPVLLNQSRLVDEDGDHPRSETLFGNVSVAGQSFGESVYIDIWPTSIPDKWTSEFSLTGGPFRRFQATVGMGDSSDSQAVVRLVITDERLTPLYSRDFRLGEHEVLDLPVEGSVRLRFEATVISGRHFERSGIALGNPTLVS